MEYKALGSDYYWLMISRLSLMARAPIIIATVILTLSPEQQGIWYLFVSLSAISYVAESGFASLMAQVVSSNCGKIKIENGYLIGDSLNTETIKHIFRYSIRCYNKLMPLVMLVNILVGFWFLSDQPFQYSIAWLCFCVFSLCNIYLMLGISLYQGLDKVASASRLRTVFNATNLLGTVFALFMGFHLWSLALGLLVSIILTSFFYLKINRRILFSIFQSRVIEKGAWYSGIPKTFRRYFLSWTSGYFILHIFVPITFYLEGAEKAGKLGLLLNIVKAATNLASTCIDSCLPSLNKLAASRKHEEFGILYKKRSILAIFLYVTVAFMIIVAAMVFADTVIVLERFPSTIVIIFMLFSELGYLINLLFAKYLRAYLIEAFHKLSLFMACIIPFLVYFGLNINSVESMAKLLCVFYLFCVVPVSGSIFRKKIKFILRTN